MQFIEKEDKDKFEDTEIFKEVGYLSLEMSDIDELGIVKLQKEEEGATDSIEEKQKSVENKDLGSVNLKEEKEEVMEVIKLEGKNNAE